MAVTIKELSAIMPPVQLSAQANVRERAESKETSSFSGVILNYLL